MYFDVFWTVTDVFSMMIRIFRCETSRSPESSSEVFCYAWMVQGGTAPKPAYLLEVRKFGAANT